MGRRLSRMCDQMGSHTQLLTEPAGNPSTSPSPLFTAEATSVLPHLPTTQKTAAAEQGVQGRCSLLLQSDNSSMAPCYPTAYAPELVLKSPEFKILEEGVVPQRNPNKNIAAAYAPGAQLHLIEKPIPKAREGEVVLHVRATGICGRCV